MRGEPGEIQRHVERYRENPNGLKVPTAPYEPRVHETPGRRVEVTPSEGQSEESIQADLDRGDELAELLLADGVQSWNSYYRWIGPIKVKVAKEVGPPPWKWPRIGVWFSRKPLGVSTVVGWRSTAYRLFLIRARKGSADGR